MGIGPRWPLTARRPVFGQHHALVLYLGNAAVRNQAAGIELDLDFVPGFADLHTAADPFQRNRVAVAVQRNVSFDIDQALVQAVNLRNPHRQRLQVQPLHGE